MFHHINKNYCQMFYHCTTQNIVRCSTKYFWLFHHYTTPYNRPRHEWYYRYYGNGARKGRKITYQPKKLNKNKNSIIKTKFKNSAEGNILGEDFVVRNYQSTPWYATKNWLMWLQCKGLQAELVSSNARSNLIYVTSDVQSRVNLIHQCIQINDPNKLKQLWYKGLWSEPSSDDKQSKLPQQLQHKGL